MTFGYSEYIYNHHNKHHCLITSLTGHVMCDVMCSGDFTLGLTVCSLLSSRLAVFSSLTHSLRLTVHSGLACTLMC